MEESDLGLGEPQPPREACLCLGHQRAADKNTVPIGQKES